MLGPYGRAPQRTVGTAHGNFIASQCASCVARNADGSVQTDITVTPSLNAQGKSLLLAGSTLVGAGTARSTETGRLTGWRIISPRTRRSSTSLKHVERQNVGSSPASCYATGNAGACATAMLL